MKMNCWLILGADAFDELAGAAGNEPAARPAPIEYRVGRAGGNDLAPANRPPTNPPAPKAAEEERGKRKPPKKQRQEEAAAVPRCRTVPLVAGPAVVVASNVNVRGQAKLKSEVVTRVTKGQQVTVLEEIVRNNSGPEEPSAWAKILLPPKPTLGSTAPSSMPQPRRSCRRN